MYPSFSTTALGEYWNEVLIIQYDEVVDICSTNSSGISARKVLK